MRTQAPGAAEPVTQSRPQPSENEESRDEPPLSGLQKDFAIWKGPNEMEQQGITLVPAAPANQ
jgi:hypothetical protein